jgi:signal transduction histidine kinase
MRRIPIRMKLAAALAMPLFALAVVTALEVAQSTRDADAIRSEASIARAATGNRGLIIALENERNWASVETSGVEDTVEAQVEGYDATRAQADDALATFRTELEDEEQAVKDAFGPALESMSDLAAIRADIDDYTGPRTPGNAISSEVYDRYAALLQPLLDANSVVVSAIDNAELRQGASIVDLATRQGQVHADLVRQLVVGSTLGGGIDTPQEIGDIAQTRATFDRFNRELLDVGEPYDRLVEELYPRELVEATSQEVEAALTTGTADVPLLLEVNDTHADNYPGMRDQFVDVVLERADGLVDDAVTRQRWFVGLAALALGVAVAVTWLVSRSITRPLRSLTRQATAMADHRLPEAVLDILDTPLGEDVEVPGVEPVAVATRDEVADVAEALNTVQDTALDLAVEQAVLRRNIADSFVNLGRRNQNLLGRQLDFITELESEETDPETLGNLFRLDHLATRMRRNAESLLVLAGVEPPRQWAAPVRLTDVIRAALGEVEDYQRVTVRGVEPATVVGAAAADLAHLLAELIENALVFSPPDQNVDIRGRGRPEGYTLAIIDSGLGMMPADIEAANRRLAGAESFTIAPSKYLGHYVAGNLAARHGIAVRLASSPGNGITATVNIPPSLLTSDVVTSAPVPPPHGMRPGRRLAGGGTALPPVTGPQRVLPAQPRPTVGTAPSPSPRPTVGSTPSSKPRPSVGATQSPWGATDAVPRPPDDELISSSRSVFGPPRSAEPEAPRWLTDAPPYPPRVPDGDLLSSLSRLAGNVRTADDRPPPSSGPAPPLARRVRGAQMPTTEPTVVRRAPSAREDRRTADDVYSFLTSFTAGVQRGLDEAESRGPRAAGR